MKIICAMQPGGRRFPYRRFGAFAERLPPVCPVARCCEPRISRAACATA